MTFQTLLNTFLNHPAVQALGWALLHFVWQGTVLAALFFVANMLTRRSQAGLRYAIGCIVMLLMPVVFVATVLRSEQFPAPRPPVQHSIALRSDGMLLDTTVVTVPAGNRRLLSVSGIPPMIRLTTLPSWIVCLWLAGIIALSVFTAIGWLRVQRFRRRGLAPVNPVWMETMESLMGRLQVSPPVRLYMSQIAEVPAVIGWLRPYILLPVSAATGLGEAELRAILAHELAHIRRCDYLVNLLQNAIETLLFYHPAVWWVSRQIRQERENCCDDLAVEVCGDVMLYAKALAHLEELRVNISEPALAATGGDLLARIRRLMGKTDERTPDRISGLLGVMLTAALVAGGLIGSGIAPTIHAESLPTSSAHSPAPPPIIASARELMAQVTQPAPVRASKAADPRLEFESATVRPEAPGVQGSAIVGGPGTRYPGELVCWGVTLRQLLARAYIGEIDGMTGPDWLDSDKWYIVAEIASGADVEQSNVMLRKLLTERFHLALHRETQGFTGYALEVESKGPERIVWASGQPPVDALLPAPRAGIPMAYGVAWLPGMDDDTTSGLDLSSDTPRLIDRTGAPGTYDSFLSFVHGAIGRIAGQSSIVMNVRGESIVVSGPLGVFNVMAGNRSDETKLKVDKVTNVPIEVLVVDHAEKVTAKM